MATHRMSLAHAEVNTARLLETVVDAAPGFDLVEVEGDAAFLSHRADRLDESALVELTLRTAADMHRAFHHERRYVAANLCPCKGCDATDRLRLKFVAHVGDVAQQTVRQRTKLVGVDVILAHRLLKNHVTLPEYVLLSDELRAGATMSVPATSGTETPEGLGEVTTWAVDVADLQASLPPLPPPSWRGRLGRTLGVAGRGLPYMVGLRRPHRRLAA